MNKMWTNRKTLAHNLIVDLDVDGSAHFQKASSTINEFLLGFIHVESHPSSLLRL